MRKIIYNSKDEGLFSWPNFVIHLGEIDPSRIIEKEDFPERGDIDNPNKIVDAVYFLPKYNIRVFYHREMGKSAKVEGEEPKGKTGLVDKFKSDFSEQ